MALARPQVIALSLSALFVLFITAVYFLGSEPDHKLPPNNFVSIYQNKQYQTIVNKISQQNHVIIEGKAEDGVDVFASYVFNVTLDENNVVYQRVFSQEPVIEDSTYPLFSMIRSFVVDTIQGEGTNRIWIIDANGPLSNAHLQAVELLATAEKTDRIVLIAEESKVKSKTFKKVNYPRPTDKSIETLLRNHGLTEFQAGRAVEHSKGNIELLKRAFDQGSLLEYEKETETQRAQISNELKENVKAAAHLKKLCKDGKIGIKKEVPELQLLQSVDFQNGQYLWVSKNYVEAYEILNSVDCQQPKSYAVVAQAEVIVVEVEPTAEPPISPAKPSKQTQKKNKKENQKNDKPNKQKEKSSKKK